MPVTGPDCRHVSTGVGGLSISFNKVYAAQLPRENCALLFVALQLKSWAPWISLKHGLYTDASGMLLKMLTSSNKMSFEPASKGKGGNIPRKIYSHQKDPAKRQLNSPVRRLISTFQGFLLAVAQSRTHTFATLLRKATYFLPVARRPRSNRTSVTGSEPVATLTNLLHKLRIHCYHLCIDLRLASKRYDLSLCLA